MELGNERSLITKEDIGSKIAVEEYNQACRKAVMDYTVYGMINAQNGILGCMENPYVTYENNTLSLYGGFCEALIKA